MHPVPSPPRHGRSLQFQPLARNHRAQPTSTAADETPRRLHDPAPEQWGPWLQHSKAVVGLVTLSGLLFLASPGGPRDRGGDDFCCAELWCPATQVDGVKFGMHRQGPLLDNEDP